MLEKFFKPSSIAVVGASRTKGKIGFSVINNLVQAQFPGKLYPINPTATDILGLKVYKNLLDVEDKIDLVVIVVPPQFVIEVIDQCEKKDIKSAIIITAGFKEIGKKGAELEKDLVRKARSFGMKIVGPNCFGILDPHSKVNATFAAAMPPPGKIAFFSQSGALCAAILDWAIGNNIGLSKFISLGNKADLTEVDFLEYLIEDPETNVILGYIEGLDNGHEFMRKATQLTKIKPVIVAKSGRSSSGARAASSHTGSLAGSDKAFTAVCNQSGIIRALTMTDLFNFAQALAYQPLPKGANLGILTNGGGPGVLAADACEDYGVVLANLSSQTIMELKEKLPPTAGIFNPIDIIGDADSSRYEVALDILMKDKGVDGVLALAIPTAQLKAESIADILNEKLKIYNKPILASLMGNVSVKEGEIKLRENGIPNYFDSEFAVKTFSIMSKYSKWKQKPLPEYIQFEVDKAKVKEVIEKAKKEGKRDLGEIETRKVISAYGFRLPKNILAETSEEAIAAAREIGYPVVMKIASPHILHKTDVGGVRVGLKNDQEVEDAFLIITTKAKYHMPNALICGVIVQEMVSHGREVILGMSRDPQFGPMLMFGLGGIYVEVMKDVSFRIAPIDRNEAKTMISEIRSFPLLKGARGQPPCDIEYIEEALLRLSQLVVDFPEIQELDINPLLVQNKGEGAIAIDARFSIKGE